MNFQNKHLKYKSKYENFVEKNHSQFGGNVELKLNSAQAIHLELKLNLSENGKSWRDLGDILYAWRLSPRHYHYGVPIEYEITNEQMKWIKSNINTVIRDNYKDEDLEFVLRAN